MICAGCYAASARSLDVRVIRQDEAKLPPDADILDDAVVDSPTNRGGAYAQARGDLLQRHQRIQGYRHRLTDGAGRSPAASFVAQACVRVDVRQQFGRWREPFMVNALRRELRMEPPCVAFGVGVFDHPQQP